MKHRILKKLIAAGIVVSGLTTLVPIGASAAWINYGAGMWGYTEGDSYATGWRSINSTWYFFDSDGVMRTGWINSGGQWYYADLSGAMQTGVIQIEGKTYLFSESSGAMQKGSCIINAKFYSFDDNGAFYGTDYPVPAKAFDYYGNSTIAYVPNQIISQDATMSSDIPSNGGNQVKQYKVTFKDPDADSSDDEILKTRYVDENTKTTLYKPTKSGYTFVEWNTKSDGDGTSYEYDDMVTIKNNITLYAQWDEITTTTTTDTIKVQTITVSGANGINQITTNGGSLQMTRSVLPSDATNQKVTWSVSNETGEATISTTTGLLTAVSNGKVTVKATATDGSGVYGTYDITISGQ
jgi:uncharacterized repeat protein (TIGR02543 family)